jgi:hypothetical protein
MTERGTPRSRSSRPTREQRTFDPIASLRTLRLGLSELGKTLEDAEETVSETHCLPLYYISDRHAVSKQPLRRARLSAVLFPVLENGSPAIATVHLRPEGNVYGGMSYGTLPQLIHQALVVAIDTVGSRRQPYQPRVLLSLSLQFVLLVLRPRSGRTLFTPVLHGSPVTPDRLLFRGGLPAFLAAAHARRHKPRDPEPAGPTVKSNL